MPPVFKPKPVKSDDLLHHGTASVILLDGSQPTGNTEVWLYRTVVTYVALDGDPAGQAPGGAVTLPLSSVSAILWEPEPSEPETDE